MSVTSSAMACFTYHLPMTAGKPASECVELTELVMPGDANERRREHEARVRRDARLQLRAALRGG